MQEFRFLATVMVKVSEAREIAEKLKAKEEIDITGWAVSEVTDAAFLHEAPWRNTWSQQKWLFDKWRFPAEVGYAQVAAHYTWEPHLDAALPEGYSGHLPSSWLAKELNLCADTTHAGVWLNQNKEIVFREFKGEENGAVCLLRLDVFKEVVGNEYTFLSVLISERNVWPGGHNSNAAWRRAEGVCWKDGRGMNVLTWSRDYCNGTSAQ